MKLTTKSEYTLILLLALSRKTRQKNNKSKQILVHLEDLCTETGAPFKYAEHLFQILKQRGIVKSKRGSSGGYLLAKETKDITLADIVRMMDGALAPTESVSKYFFSHTPIEKEKKLLKVFKDIRDHISKKMESTTLEDLV